jgi:hypothetical protein
MGGFDSLALPPIRMRPLAGSGIDRALKRARSEVERGIVLRAVPYFV